jgi:hypothetical protein
MKRLLFAAVITVVLSGCSSPINYSNDTTSKTIDVPAINQVVTKGLGERLVAKGTQTTGLAVTVSQPTQFGKKEGESSILTCALTVQPNTYFKVGVHKSDYQTNCFGPVYALVTTADGSTNMNCLGTPIAGSLCKNPNDGYFFTELVGNVKFDLEQDFNHLTIGEKTVQNENNFVQELIYNGRVGNSLKVVYREFSNNTIRPHFSQEIQYDLSESNVIGFKSLRLEVIEATNTEVKYKLLKNFN